MWDDLAKNSGFKKVLPTGRNWQLKEQKFDRDTVHFSFESLKEKEVYHVEFQPVHLSISDEWVEDYGGLNKHNNSQITLGDVADNIGKNFPEQKEDYNDLNAYFISAMEWNITFISNSAPSVTRIG